MTPKRPFPTLDAFFGSAAAAPNFSNDPEEPVTKEPRLARPKQVAKILFGDIGIELTGHCVGAWRTPAGQSQRNDTVTLWVKDETGIIPVHVEGKQVVGAEALLGRLVLISDPSVRTASSRGSSKAKVPKLSNFSLEVKDHKGEVTPIDLKGVPIDERFLRVLAPDAQKPVSLREVIAGKTSERVFVQVLSIGEAKKSNKGVSQRNVTVSDGELVLQLCLWGSQSDFAASFKRLKTILLLTSPKVSVYGGNVQLSLGYQSLIEVIEGKEADLMRAFTGMISQQKTPPDSDRDDEAHGRGKAQKSVAPAAKEEPVQPVVVHQQQAPKAEINHILSQTHATIQDLQALSVSSKPPISHGYTVAILIRLDPEDEQPFARWIDETGQWTTPIPSPEVGGMELQLWARHAIEWKVSVDRNETGEISGNKIEIVRVTRATGIMKQLCEAAACSL